MKIINKLLKTIIAVPLLGTSISIASCNTTSNENTITSAFHIEGDYLIEENVTYEYKIVENNKIVNNDDIIWSFTKAKTSTAHVNLNGNKLTITSTGTSSNSCTILLLAKSKTDKTKVASFSVTAINDQDPDRAGKIKFSRDSWANVCNLADSGKNALHTYYNISDPKGLVGVERTIKINGLDHRVAVIDENHDTTITGQILTLSFQLKTVVSDENGNPIQTRYTSEREANIFPHYSTLYKTLNNEGEQVEWHDDNHEQVSKKHRTSCIDMIKKENPTLWSAIQPSLKEIAVNPGGIYSTEAWVLTKYEAKIFPLTATEIGADNIKPTYGTVEGHVYKYYENRALSDLETWITYTLKGQPISFPIASVTFKMPTETWGVLNNGAIISPGFNCNDIHPVNFAFSLGLRS